MNTEVCSRCGGSGPFGYEGETRETAVPVCYPCCGRMDEEWMIEHGEHGGLYLVIPQRPHVKGVRHFCESTAEVTNWPGSLRFKVRPWLKKGKHACFGGYTDRVDFWFPGPDGFVWHGIVRGDMQLARCKRTKERT